jgi:hypothetical protein
MGIYELRRWQKQPVMVGARLAFDGERRGQAV